MRLALGTLACALVASGGGGDRSTIPSPHAQSVYEWVKHKSASRETQAPITRAIDVSREPLLGGVLAQRPIEVVGGLPVLTDELAWDDATPLYVLGGFAQLQLGPDALNLAGARAGTVRVARALRPQLRS